MLRLVLISLFIVCKALGQEPEALFIVSQGKVNQIKFSDLKQVEITTINHHPKMKPLGAIKYTGYLVKDILSQVKLRPSDYVTLVGKTGQFSIEISVDELLAPNNIIATHINGVPMKTEENGLQVIYSQEAIEKYPRLKERQYWLWWVRIFITDEKFIPEVKAIKAHAILKSQLPWPVPYGISSKGQLKETNARSGRLLEFNKLKVDLLNGVTVEVSSDSKTKYFLTDPVGNKSGAYGLHQVLEKDGKVQTIVSNLYYVKRVEAIE